MSNDARKPVDPAIEYIRSRWFPAMMAPEGSLTGMKMALTMVLGKALGEGELRMDGDAELLAKIELAESKEALVELVFGEDRHVNWQPGRWN